MLADLAHQRLAVMLGHPVLGFDEVACVDLGVEPALQLSLFERADGLALFFGRGVHGLGVHLVGSFVDSVFNEFVSG